MTRKQYIELTGEDPIEMFGSDWENILKDLEMEATEDEIY